MNKITKILLLSSSWIFYIGYLIYNFIVSETKFFGIFPAFFMGFISPFLLWETRILAFVLIIALVVAVFKKWQYKWWIIGILQWGYFVLMWFSMNVLANIV